MKLKPFLYKIIITSFLALIIPIAFLIQFTENSKSSWMCPFGQDFLICSYSQYLGTSPVIYFIGDFIISFIIIYFIYGLFQNKKS